MARQSSFNSRLQSIGNEQRRTFGGRPPVAVKKAQTTLPTNIIFWNNETGDTFPFNTNGISQFLRKCQLPDCKENVDWLVDNLLNMPITETFNVEGVCSIGMSCECYDDPGNASLSQLGIAKSMIVRPQMPVTHSNHVQKDIIMPPQYGMTDTPYLIYDGQVTSIPDGEGVLFGQSATSLIAKMRKGSVRTSTSFVGHNETGDIGGLMGGTNLVGSHRLQTNGRGWQDEE